MEPTIRFASVNLQFCKGARRPMRSSKEHRKRHASEFQSKRNDHGLVMCNMNKLHSQGDCVPRDITESRYAQTPAPDRVYFRRRPYISRPFTRRRFHLWLLGISSFSISESRVMIAKWQFSTDTRSIYLSPQWTIETLIRLLSSF